MSRLGWTRKWLVSVVITILLLATLEGLFWLFGVGRDVRPLVDRELQQQRLWSPNRDFYDLICIADPTTGSYWEAQEFYLSKVKPPETVRIFVYGGSAAQGMPPDPAYAFWRILGVMLEEGFPDTKIELSCQAMAATDSFCHYACASAATALQPDFFVLYAGNNEITGEWGSKMGDESGKLGDRVWPIRLSNYMKTWRLWQVKDMLAQMLKPLIAPEEELTTEMLVEMMRVRDSASPNIEAIYQRFKRNVSDIAGCAEDSGAELILCTVGTNLRNWEPFLAAHSDGLPDSAKAAWQAHYDQGMADLAANRPEAALPHFEACVEIDPAHANGHFQLGRCRLAAGEVGPALASFKAARDADCMPSRANSRINETIRTIAAEHESVCLADVETAMEEASEAGVPGWDFYYDCMHGNFKGNYVIAATVYKELASRLVSRGLVAEHTPPSPPDRATCARALGLTKEVELELLDSMANGFLKGVREALGTPWCVEEEEATRKELQAEIGAQGTRDPVEVFREFVEQRPRDHVLRARLIRGLLAEGDASGALHEAERFRELWPYRRGAERFVGLCLERQGKEQEAKALFEAELARFPDDEDSRQFLGLN